MKYDKPMVAALIGALSTISAEILTRAFTSFGIGQYSVYQLDSLLITQNRPTLGIGLIVNLIIGGLVGILFYYSLEKIGFDYLVIKSACVGLLAWSGTELVITDLVEGKTIPLRPIAGYYVHMLVL
ncbi:MAG TPA: hypothetical protein DD730_06225 [Desulfosporosinus sp.]|nr:hypothetical protein [Desulfosporosinus sp.]